MQFDISPILRFAGNMHDMCVNHLLLQRVGVTLGPTNTVSIEALTCQISKSWVLSLIHFLSTFFFWTFHFFWEWTCKIRRYSAWLNFITKRNGSEQKSKRRNVALLSVGRGPNLHSRAVSALIIEKRYHIVPRFFTWHEFFLQDDHKVNDIRMDNKKLVWSLLRWDA